MQFFGVIRGPRGAGWIVNIPDEVVEVFAGRVVTESRGRVRMIGLRGTSKVWLSGETREGVGQADRWEFRSDWRCEEQG